MTGPMPFDKATTAPYHAVSNLYAGTCHESREANQNSLIFATLSQRNNIANLWPQFSEGVPLGRSNQVCTYNDLSNCHQTPTSHTREGPEDDELQTTLRQGCRKGPKEKNEQPRQKNKLTGPDI
jgi:hypothetical protein